MIRNKKRKADAATEAEAEGRAAAAAVVEDQVSADDAISGHATTDETACPEAESEAESETESETAALEDRIAALEAERDEAVGQYKRALADYHNYQKRSVQNERAASEYGRQDVVRDLIPVLDNLDLALEHGAGPEDVESENAAAVQIRQAVQMVHEALLQLMGKRGVTRLTAARGDDFDPTCQEAVMMQPSADVEPQQVLQMIQVGYQMNDTVLRPTKVVIAQALPTAAEVDADESDVDANSSTEEA